MIRFLLRASGFVLLAVAFATLVADGTRSIAAQRLLQFPLGEVAAWLGGARYAALVATAEAWPEAGRALLQAVLAAPAWAVTGLLGLVLLLAGRRPRAAPGFAGR